MFSRSKFFGLNDFFLVKNWREADLPKIKEKLGANLSKNATFQVTFWVLIWPARYKRIKTNIGAHKLSYLKLSSKSTLRSFPLFFRRSLLFSSKVREILTNLLRIQNLQFLPDAKLCQKLGGNKKVCFYIKLPCWNWFRIGNDRFCFEIQCFIKVTKGSHF